ELSLVVLWFLYAGVPELPDNLQTLFQSTDPVFWGQTERCLVHKIAGAESEEESFWKLVGECCQCLGYDGRLSPDHVCYCDSDSDPPGPGSYCGKSRERFRRGCGFCPVEQMVV